MKAFLFFLIILSSHIYGQVSELNPLELIKFVRSPTQLQKYLLSKGCVLTEIKDEYYMYRVFKRDQLIEDGEGEFYNKRPTAVASDTNFYDVVYIENLNDLVCEGSKRKEYIYAWEYSETTSMANVWLNYNILEKISCSIPEKILETWEGLDLSFSSTELYQSFLNELMKSSKFIDSREVEGNISQVFVYEDPNTKKKCEIWCTKHLNEEGGEFGIYWQDYF